MYSFREDWHQDACANPLIRQYQVALDAVLKCRPELRDCAVACCHCGIRFLTHPRNAKRQNLRCPFGCRDHHRRQRANERSRKHYKKPSARTNKKFLNGKRSKFGNDTAVDALPARPSFVEDPAVEQPVLEEPPVEEAAVEEALVEEAVSTQVANCEAVNREAVSCLRAESARELVSANGTGETLTGKPTRVVLELPLEGFVLKESALLNSSTLPYARMVASLILRRAIGREELLTRLLRRMRQHSMGRLSRREYVLHFLNQHPP